MSYASAVTTANRHRRALSCASGIHVNPAVWQHQPSEKTMSKLNDKVAVVSGASKGIGAGIAKQLAAASATVVVNYLSSREGADKVVEEITAAAGKAVAIGANVAIESELVRMEVFPVDHPAGPRRGSG
jgi:5,10-methylene-tetrahydrofolate dehydrogenase/methenyl tetrahydrofolate cyclohydrolase